ncbi:MAG TPA: hypothetical protein VLD37_00655 [Candidatus Bilamarchaeum sp.]|nr:hypothetical protein [Candidatus Bilamarchaeum sp.]
MDYESLRDKYESVYSGCGKRFPGDCKAIESALAFSFALSSSMRQRKLDDKKGFLLAFFYRNSVYLSAAYHMARMGMLDPAGNNLRAVFETIIWQYAYLFEDGYFQAFMKINAMERDKFAKIRQKAWSNTKERALENLRRKYNFQKMMKKLYTKEYFESFFFNQYWVLSQKSHSGLFGVNNNTPSMEGQTTLEKSPGEMKDNLTAILYLSAENLICFLNCFSDELSPGQVGDALKEANRINAFIPPAQSLAPDTKKPEFSIRLRKSG